jgi:exopolysaccharide biosynthesis polyprenyl glycosylphosphotransferase
MNRMKKADLFFNVARVPVDFTMLVAAGVATYFLRTQILDVFRPVAFTFNLPLIVYLPIVVGVAGLFMALFAISGLYSMRVRTTLTTEFLRIAVASSAAIMLLIVYIFLRQELFNSRFLVLGGWFIAIIFVFVGRILIRQAQRYFVSKFGFGVHRLMVIGDDRASQEVVKGIRLDPYSGYNIVKQLSNPELSEVIAAVGNPGVDEIILANPNYPADKVTQLVDFCHENHIIFKFIPNIYQTLTTHFDVDVIKNMPVIELKRTSLDGWGKVFKRIFDVLASSAGIVMLSPLMLAVAFAIKWETEGPVLVRLKRVSKNREFYLYKFRGMVKNAEELLPYLLEFNERKGTPLFKMKNDPRLTRVGKFIRRFRIDELPQFFNVINGDMSLVGPRPHQPDEIAKYEKHHKKVLAIEAGATGLAQISGSSDLPFEEEVALDTFYIENWSLLLDVKIIFRTIFKAFTSDTSAV